MAKYNLGEAYKELPTWAKGVIFVGGAAVLVALGLTVRNFIRRKSEEGGSRQTLQDTTNELRELAKRGIFPSYTDAQYSNWADAAEQCYQGIGTCSGDTIFVNMKNDADVLKLIQAYGVRTIRSGIWGVSDVRGGLAVAMRSELSIGDINSINNLLSKKGIKYKF